MKSYKELAERIVEGEECAKEKKLEFFDSSTKACLGRAKLVAMIIEQYWGPEEKAEEKQETP